MIFDTHIHTEFSSDSKMKIEDAIQSAKMQNLGLILTEHYDLGYKGEGFKCDIPNYLKTYEKYRTSEVLLGIEIGLTPATLQVNEQVTKENPFDYVLASIHEVLGRDIFLEYSKEDLEERLFYEQYYKFMIECLQMYNDYDALAHIDYIYRYVSFEDKEMRIAPYKELIAEVMKTLISKEKAIEINTRRLANPGTKEALLEVYKFYKDLGGRYITIGSDSHYQHAIGKSFKEALEIADTLGLQPVYFKNRKMQYCNLK